MHLQESDDHKLALSDFGSGSPRVLQDIQGFAVQIGRSRVTSSLNDKETNNYNCTSCSGSDRIISGYERIISGSHRINFGPPYNLRLQPNNLWLERIISGPERIISGSDRIISRSVFCHIFPGQNRLAQAILTREDIRATRKCQSC